MNKKFIVAVGIAAISIGAFAGPHGGPRHGGFHGGPRFGGFRGGPRPVMHHGGFHHRPIHHVTTPTVVTTTPVVTAPAATVQNVWVEGRYVDQVQANGTVIRVWQPGHYEQREVLLQ